MPTSATEVWAPWPAATGRQVALKRRRAAFQLGFFCLFVLAPPLDLLRFDLNANHLILFGNPWTLGLDAFLRGEVGGGEAALSLLVRGLLPIAFFAGGLIWVAWRWGRLYCGWLCPHFSVVELINGLMLRASGKPNLWEPRPLPERRPDGSRHRPNRWYWLPTALAVVLFAFLWALTLLTYLLPPAEIYPNLLGVRLTPNQFAFLVIATGVLTIEFGFVRHLFCRFGCAVGLFQSLAWMANERALVVTFDAVRGRACRDCNGACDNACPMRLSPRAPKRRMFTCTQCRACIAACTLVQRPHASLPLLHWVADEAARATIEPRPRPRDGG